MRFIADDAMAALLEEGEYQKRRASHIEPDNPVIRAAFHFVRRHASDESLMAAITRRWPCLWRVNLSPVGGPIFGPYHYRSRALEVERNWLVQNRLGSFEDAELQHEFQRDFVE